MKARWLSITVLLAFSFAFAFFLREARVGEKPNAIPRLVVSPASTRAEAAAPVEIASTVPANSPVETPLSAPVTKNATVTQPSTDTKPVLLEGTFVKEDGSLIYDSDAKLRLASDVILSSPTGVMVSNEKQTLFAGDMQIESGKNTITAHEGVLDTQANRMKATVASIAFTNENNQLIRMTGENVTLDLPTNAKAAPEKEMVADSIRIESKGGTFSGTAK